MHEFLIKIGMGIVSILTALGMYQAPIQTPIDLGSQLAVGGETYYLGGSGTSLTDNTINLTKFGYVKPDGTYQKFSMSNFGTLGCGTFEPGNMKGKQEFVSFTGVTQNSDSTAQLTGVSRGLERFSPYAASTTLQASHAGSTKFVISNSPPCFYENYVTINNAETITSVKTFSVSPIVPTPVGATEAVNKTYVDGGILAGAATSTESVTGIVRLATRLQTASSTATTANTPLVIQAQSATSTRGILGTYVVVSENDGKLNQNWLDLTEGFAFGGVNTYTGNNTFSTSTIYNFNVGAIVGTSTVVIPASVASPLTLNGVSTNWPSSLPSVSTSSMVMDTTGTIRYTNPAPEILLQDNAQYETQGTATTTVLTYKLPANTLGINNSLIIDAGCSHSGTNGYWAGCEIGFGNGTATNTIAAANSTPDHNYNWADLRVKIINANSQTSQISDMWASATDYYTTHTSIFTASSTLSTLNTTGILYITFRAKTGIDTQHIGFQGITITKY